MIDKQEVTFTDDSIVTEIAESSQFYLAKDDDQRYYLKNETLKPINHKIWFHWKEEEPNGQDHEEKSNNSEA
jgi:peptide methionine sulfoxide reductase MsrA